MDVPIKFFYFYSATYRILGPERALRASAQPAKNGKTAKRVSASLAAYSDLLTFALLGHRWQGN
jgi:hypothetical protein